MAITKRLKVTFDVTSVVDSEMIAQMDELILTTARKLNEGHNVSPFKKEVVRQALTGGAEAAIEFILKSGLREFIRESHKELNESERKLLRMSPATIRVVK